MSNQRKAIGILMLIAAPIILIVGYSNLPDASTCQFINQQNAALGLPPSCSTTPAAGYFIGAAIIGGVGLLMLMPWILRWLTGGGSKDR